MQLNTKVKTWGQIKRYKKQPALQRNRRHRTALSAGPSHPCCTAGHERREHISSDTEVSSPQSDWPYSCQMLQQSSTAMKTGSAFGVVFFFLPLFFFSLQALATTEMDHHRLECCHAAFVLYNTQFTFFWPCRSTFREPSLQFTSFRATFQPTWLRSFCTTAFRVWSWERILEKYKTPH